MLVPLRLTSFFFIFIMLLALGSLNDQFYAKSGCLKRACLCFSNGTQVLAGVCTVTVKSRGHSFSAIVMQKDRDLWRGLYRIGPFVSFFSFWLPVHCFSFVSSARQFFVQLCCHFSAQEIRALKILSRKNNPDSKFICKFPRFPQPMSIARPACLSLAP